MSETKTSLVKRIRDMNEAELHALPHLKAKLLKNVFKKSDQVNLTLQVEVAPDYNAIFKLTEEQFAIIRLERGIDFDKQQLEVYARISKGMKKDGTTFMMLEVVPCKGIYLNELLTTLRVRQVEALSQKGTWPKNLRLENYPDAAEDIKFITFEQ